MDGVVQIPSQISYYHTDWYEPHVSDDGRYVAFVSRASLVAEDTNNLDDVYVADLATDELTWVSKTHDGRLADGGSWKPEISPDGRYVGFMSRANNLLPVDRDSSIDLFVFDRLTQQLECITADQNGDALALRFSGDSQSIVYEFEFNDTVPQSPNAPTKDAVLYDRLTGQRRILTTGYDGNPGNGITWRPHISHNGQYVVFQSKSSNLVPGDTPNTWDVFLYDVAADRLECLSVDTQGNPANGESQSVRISADGRFVTFHSTATNLTAPNADNRENVYLLDRATGELQSIAGDGTPGGAAAAVRPDITSDGRFVIYYTTQAPDGISAPDNVADVFVYDRLSGETRCVSVQQDGFPSGATTSFPSISGMGGTVVFLSDAANLVTGSAPASIDLFAAPNPFIEITAVVSADPATRTITVSGRNRLDDRFQATLGESLLSIVINDELYEFLRAEYDTVNFDGRYGRDTAEVFGSDADNYGEMSYKSGWSTDGNVRVNLADSEILTLHGGAGYDEVKMFDSVFNDVWTAERLSAAMDARLAPSDLEPIYLNSADGFERILAVANEEGRDKAILNDSPDVDFVTMQPNDFAWMGLRSELYNEVAPILTYFNRASQFEDIEANSTKGGADVVKFKDWNGADTMHAWPTHATMSNATNTYSFLATGFDYMQSMVYKERRLGLDTAYMYGLDGADLFVANGDTRYTLMKHDDVYAIVAKYFGKVYADTGTGNDTVKILDDPGIAKELLEVKDSDSLGWDAGCRWLRYSNLDSNATIKFAYEVAECETATARSSNVMDKSEIDAAVDAWMAILGTGGWRR